MFSLFLSLPNSDPTVQILRPTGATQGIPSLFASVCTQTRKVLQWRA